MEALANDVTSYQTFIVHTDFAQSSRMTKWKKCSNLEKWAKFNFYRPHIGSFGWLGDLQDHLDDWQVIQRIRTK